MLRIREKAGLLDKAFLTVALLSKSALREVQLEFEA
jgi:hypothetical protein